MGEARYADVTRVRRVAAATWLTALVVLVGCSPGRTPRSERVVEVVPGSAAPAIHRPVPTPTPSAVPTPLHAVAVHKSFTDPPLPPELRDDSGLAPLPPRPAPSAMATTMRPTFERAAPITTGEDRP